MVTLPMPDFVQALQSGFVPPPRARILVLGLEPILQLTRAKILEEAGFECYVACELPTPSTLMNAMFRVALLCQSLDSMHACAIQETLRRSSPTTAVLRFRKPSRALDTCFGHLLFCPTPNELITAVQQLSHGTRDSANA